MLTLVEATVGRSGRFSPTPLACGAPVRFDTEFQDLYLFCTIRKLDALGVTVLCVVLACSCCYESHYKH